MTIHKDMFDDEVDERPTIMVSGGFVKVSDDFKWF